MPCEQHQWWFSIPCPQCADQVREQEEDLSIPDYLLRNPDNTLKFPLAPVAQQVELVAHNDLVAGSNPAGRTNELTLAERQPIYRKMHEDQKRQEITRRIAKLKSERHELQDWEKK